MNNEVKAYLDDKLGAAAAAINHARNEANEKSPRTQTILDLLRQAQALTQSCITTLEDTAEPTTQEHGGRAAPPAAAPRPHSALVGKTRPVRR